MKYVVYKLFPIILFVSLLVFLIPPINLFFEIIRYTSYSICQVDDFFANFLSKYYLFTIIPGLALVGVYLIFNLILRILKKQLISSMHFQIFFLIVIGFLNNAIYPNSSSAYIFLILIVYLILFFFIRFSKFVSYSSLIIIIFSIISSFCLFNAYTSFVMLAPICISSPDGVGCYACQSQKIKNDFFLISAIFPKQSCDYYFGKLDFDSLNPKVNLNNEICAICNEDPNSSLQLPLFINESDLSRMDNKVLDQKPLKCGDKLNKY